MYVGRFCEQCGFCLFPADFADWRRFLASCSLPLASVLFPADCADDLCFLPLPVGRCPTLRAARPLALGDAFLLSAHKQGNFCTYAPKIPYARKPKSTRTETASLPEARGWKSVPIRLIRANLRQSAGNKTEARGKEQEARNPRQSAKSAGNRNLKSET